MDPDVAKTLSPYGYVKGDPLNVSDPGGLTNDASSGGFGNLTSGPGAGCYVNLSGGPALCPVGGGQVAPLGSVPAGGGLDLCLRGPIGAGWNSNSNGGCQTTLSGSQGAQLIGATVVTAIGTVGTLGLSDVLAAGISADLASGTLLGLVNGGAGALGAWSILGLPATVGGIGVYWGYSALTADGAVSAAARGCGT